MRHHSSIFITTFYFSFFFRYWIILHSFTPIMLIINFQIYQWIVLLTTNLCVVTEFKVSNDNNRFWSLSHKQCCHPTTTPMAGTQVRSHDNLYRPHKQCFLPMTTPNGRYQGKMARFYRSCKQGILYSGRVEILLTSLTLHFCAYPSQNRFNLTTYLCLSQPRTWISIYICHGNFFLQWLRSRDSCLWCR